METERQSLDYGSETQPTVSRLAAKFCLLGGGIAWLLHFLAIYVISEFGCVSGWSDWIVGRLSMVVWLLLLATLLTGAMAVAAVWAAAHTRKTLRGAEAEDAAEPAETKSFVGRLSLILNGLFLFIILVQAVPIFFYLKSC